MADDAPANGALAPPAKKKKWTASERRAMAESKGLPWKWGRVTPEILSFILERSAHGQTMAEISTAVADCFLVDLPPGRVWKEIRKHRQERHEHVVALTRAQLGRFVVSDLEHLSMLTEQGAELVQDAYAKRDTKEWRGLAEQLRKLIETRLHFLGIDTKDTTDLRKLSDPEFEALKSAFLSKLSGPRPIAPPAMTVEGQEVKDP